ncbi:MAG: IPT/TIG domain-containing protein [Pyrinomonadaceae bacterium]
MALFEGKTPAERNKMIAAIALPLLALIFVFNMLSGPSKPSAGSATPTPTPRRPPRVTGQQAATGDAQLGAGNGLVSMMTPIDCCPTPYGGGDGGRNIFAFYVKPTPPPAAPPTPPPATPEPPPPIVLGALAPQSIFARTAGFKLQVSGDKFGPAARVYVDGQELPTQFKSMQQLTADVPAALISSPGQRSVVVRTPDGQLYSNPATINVMQPPAPTYTYVGFLKRQRANTAVLKDAKGELYSVRQGDLVEGRFRVADITERGVELVDKDLNIKHTMPFVDARGMPGSAPGRAPGSIQPPPPDPEGDDEP